ncbi:ketopantoate reductase family protein [Kushneria marisflavi]|uniref:2-dehydropantoate 2-reductase n=1 Tax=Kushneria marisflavi TaxID=157779 RepID=A0A240UTK5_9GAMM|nr:ketopantoate reductase family protein [Kushneria marisflavi]ART64359.1 2-dehydropantoate 2-reductase [Kushneria marisflavi]RKD76828.1 ketopantoate reductase [Kushneria marisflavi]
MQIAIMGAGAVGSYYGALLARAGHTVALIGRAAHVEAVQSKGLILETASGCETLEVTASQEVCALKDAELVLFCVKSTDTETAGASMASALSETAVVMSLQNGVDNADRLAEMLGREVIPVVVYAAVSMAGSGHVRHHGGGELALGSSDVGASLVALFQEAGMSATVADNVTDMLWTKLVINCAWNAVSAITQQPYGALMAIDGVRALVVAVMGECQIVAQACGVILPDDMERSTLAIAEVMSAQRSSTAQDLARARQSEIEHLNGFIVRQARCHGIETPINHTLLVLVRALEQGRHRCDLPSD